MKILAIDAATEGCSVALNINGDIISKFEVAPQKHSKLLLPFVDEILAEAGIDLSQVDFIAYGQGPGSFTGVRIGVSVTQGLAFALDLPVVGVSSLATMAQEVIERHDAQHVYAAIDARMSEIYWGVYSNVNGIAHIDKTEIAIKPENLITSDTLVDDKYHAAGTGWQTYAEILGNKVNAINTDVLLPNAKYMFPSAIHMYQNGFATNAELAHPNYVRDEVSWKKLPGR